MLIRVTGLRGQPRQLQGVGHQHHAPAQAEGQKSSKTERSKQIEVEARTPASCGGGEHDPGPSWISATALRCSIATPLGRPVEPEV